MTHAYDEMYLEKAQDALGSMLDYAVHDLNYEADDFFGMFLGTGIAEEFAHGDPCCIVGRSGEELACDVIWISRKEDCCIPPTFRSGKSPVYWAGWILAGYQWYRNVPFKRIAEAVTCRKIMDDYSPYHEMDELQFYDVMDTYMKAREPLSRLKRLREYARLSQSQLAHRSGVPVRTIQQYEQNQKNINHAKGSTLLHLANALNCRMEDLLAVRIDPDRSSAQERIP